MAEDRTEACEFLWGEELLARESQIENELERATNQLLASGKLGSRAPEVYRKTGNALSFLMQIASCQWGCKKREHIRENFVRRLANYSFGTLRLTRLGLYNEAVALLRAAAELVNLIELLTIDRQVLQQWLSLSTHERWRHFRPVRVQERIAATGNCALVGRDIYAAMCEFGVHVTPESASFSHQFDGRVHVGGEFAVPAFLLVLNELAILLGAFLKVVGYFAEVPKEKLGLLADAGRGQDMKARYIVALAIIILAMILFEYLLLAHPMGDRPKLGNTIQAAAVFVALLAAVAAIAASDPKPKQVNVGIEPYISTGEAETHSKTELPDSLFSAFAHLQDTFQSYRVHFRLTNLSGFTLVAPTITLRLPIDRHHPHRVNGHFIATFNSNLFNSQEALYVLE
jgi:hypothetical protein